MAGDLLSEEELLVEESEPAAVEGAVVLDVAPRESFR